MKYLSLALIIIAAMAANMVADLNFVDGTHDAEGWDAICGTVIMSSSVILVFVVIFDTIRDGLR